MTDDETWVEGDHANTLNRFDVGDTRTTHIVVNSESYWVEDCENAALRANGSNDGPPRTDKQPLITETFSVYPEGGNGADIAAANTPNSAYMEGTTAAGGTTGAANMLIANNLATAFLGFSAEL